MGVDHPYFTASDLKLYELSICLIFTNDDLIFTLDSHNVARSIEDVASRKSLLLKVNSLLNSYKIEVILQICVLQSPLNVDRYQLKDLMTHCRNSLHMFLANSCNIPFVSS